MTQYIVSTLIFFLKADDINEEQQMNRKSSNDAAEVKPKEQAQWVKTPAQ